MKQRIPVSVRAYAGYRSDQSPRHVVRGEVDIEVSRVVGQTMEQTRGGRRLRRFQVVTPSQQEFTLIHDVETDQWYLETKE